jgi:hypothetical protein
MDQDAESRNRSDSQPAVGANSSLKGKEITAPEYCNSATPEARMRYGVHSAPEPRKGRSRKPPKPSVMARSWMNSSDSFSWLTSPDHCPVGWRSTSVSRVFEYGVPFVPDGQLPAAKVCYRRVTGRLMLIPGFTALDPERNLGRPSRSAKTYTSHCSRVTAALGAWFLHDQDPIRTSASLTVDRGLDESRRSLRRERELKRRPLWYVRLSPDSSPVRFDNRAADR